MGSNETGLNEMGVSKTDELIVNEIGVNGMGSESRSRHHYYPTECGKGKHNETHRKAEFKFSRSIVNSL